MAKLTFLLIIISFISCAPARSPSARSPSARITKRIPEKRISNSPSTSLNKKIPYVIKKGDSLWQISKKYGVSPKRIMKENNIASAHNLKVGQKIFIPRTSQRNKPFIWPVEGRIINFFNENIGNSQNKGLNIKLKSNNKKVKAAAQGKVVFSNYLKGWGKTIILKHRPYFYTIYANLESASLKENSFAKQGQTIGNVTCGKNGNYILHFEIRKKYIPQDPLRYLN